MGFLAPAMPWIIKGGSLLGGWLAGRKAQSSAQQRSPEEAAALSGATNAASGLTRQGQTLTSAGLPAAQQSLSYYGTLLRGNRAAQAQATAAPRGAITDTYRGAERSLERSGLRGAGRDQAIADLNRDRAGSISSLVTGVQPGAAAALMQGGTNLISEGNAAFGNAGSIYGGLLGQGFANRKYAREEGEKTGSSIGSFLFDILSGGFGKKGGGKGIPGLPGGSAGPF